MEAFKEHKIKEVSPESPADRAGIRAGDILLSAGGQAVADVFDFRMATSEAEALLKIRTPDGDIKEVVLKKDPYEDTGLTFESALMDDYRSCRNKCIFCFIDQMPPGMRQTLYFKDDDSRLSFLQGNYVTLTNMSDDDIKRIIRYRLEPINVSVHTTNPALRCKMLNNRFAGDALRHIKTLSDAGIEMNAQIVLCKDINDGAELERTIGDLMGYMPAMVSVSVVPAGLTKYRDGLPKLKEFSEKDAADVIDLIERYQKRCMEKSGIRFIHASDEFYLLAGRDIPKEEEYDGYPQLENGVGMIRLLMDEFREAMRSAAEEEGKSKKGFAFFKKKDKRPKEEAQVKRSVSLATGTLAAPLMRKLSAEFMAENPGISINVFPIRNDFFGESITVSGLLTGQDIIAQLKGKELGEELLLPENLLRSGEDVLLDDVTVSEIERELGVSICVVDAQGQALYDALRGRI